MIAPTDGNVGIGTNSPASKLDVQGTSAQFYNKNGTFALRNIGYGAAPSLEGYRSVGSFAAPSAINATNLPLFEIDAYGYGASNFIAASGKIQFISDGAFTGSSLPTKIQFSTTPSGSTSSQARMLISSNGRVGVGTSAPLGNLDVQNEVVVSSNGSYSQLGFANLSNTGGYSDGTASDKRTAVIDTYSIAGSNAGQNGGQLSFYTKPADAGGGVQARMIITDTGKIGIGTTAPTSLLNINNNFQGNATSSSNKIFRVEGQNVPDSNYILAEFVHGGSVPALMATASGRVGIGVSAPTAALDVGGQFTVNTTTGAVKAGNIIEHTGYIETPSDWPTCAAPAKIYSLGVFGSPSSWGKMEVEVIGTHRGMISYFENKKWIVTVGDFISTTLVSNTSKSDYVDMWDGVTAGPISDQTVTNGRNLQLIVNPYCGAAKRYAVTVRYSANVEFTPSTLSATMYPSSNHSGTATFSTPTTYTTGKFGIGTATPWASFHVATKFSAPFNANSPSIVVGDTTDYSAASNSNYSGSIMFTGNNANHGFITYRPRQSNDRSRFEITGYSMSYDDAHADLTVNGRVGIGTKTPAHDLEVVGNMRVSHPSGSTQGAMARFENSTNLGYTTINGIGSSSIVPTWNDGAQVLELVPAGSGDGIVSSYTGKLRFQTSTRTDQMTIEPSGNVGIGTTTPSYRLDVVGDINASGSVRAAGVALSSDARFKKNIEEITNPLGKILSLRGVEYDWRRDEFPERQFSTRHQVGVIAQEVEKVFPELVDTDKSGYKSVNYPALIAPVIGAIKELYMQITGVNEKVTSQSRQIASLQQGQQKIIKELEAQKRQAEKLEQENKLLKQYLCAKDPQAVICR